MIEFVAALLVFLLLHVVPAIPSLRGGLVARLGRRTYLAAYSIVSVVAVIWLFNAALRLDFIPLWEPARWQGLVPLLLTPIGMVLLLAGLFSPNPASISLRRDATLGAVSSVTRHPVLWGFIFWSGSHLVANGDLRSVLLFGALFGFALLGIPITERRARRRLGAGWADIAATTSILPGAALLVGRTHLRVDGALLLALLLSAAATAWLLLGGHADLFGAAPLAQVAL